MSRSLNLCRSGCSAGCSMPSMPTVFVKAKEGSIGGSVIVMVLLLVPMSVAARGLPLIQHYGPDQHGVNGLFPKQVDGYPQRLDP